MFANHSKHEVTLEKHFYGSFLVVSYVSSFDKAAAKHMIGTIGCWRTYSVASKGLASHSWKVSQIGKCPAG